MALRKQYFPKRRNNERYHTIWWGNTVSVSDTVSVYTFTKPHAFYAHIQSPSFLLGTCVHQLIHANIQSCGFA